MEKSPDAFRTISEVAEWLDIPTHVLRFWESRFSQIKPVKRAGGRRYYRPSDMRLIGGVKTLLHDQGMTIRGVQKVLREQGIKHVSSFSKALDSDVADADVIEHEPVTADATAPAPPARDTREAEPVEALEERETSAEEVVPSEETAPVGTDDESHDQPDMFPDGKSSQPEDQIGAVIPETPDVPSEDVDDDAPGYATDPGIAARLAGARASDLAKHRAELATAKERLLSLRSRLQ